MPEKNQEIEQRYKNVISKSIQKISDLNAELEIYRKGGDIAIIGMGCRMPNAAFTPDAFWQNLINRIDSVSEVNEERIALGNYFSDSGMPLKYGAFLNEIDMFDAQFFSITPKEALQLDPQQRLLLETT